MSWRGWQKLHMLIGFPQEWKALTKPKQRIRNNIQKQILNTLTNLPYNSGLFELLLGLLLLITHDSLPDFTTSTPSCACDEKKKKKKKKMTHCCISYMTCVFCSLWFIHEWTLSCCSCNIMLKILEDLFNFYTASFWQTMMTGEPQHLTTTFHKNVAHTYRTIMQKK